MNDRSPADALFEAAVRELDSGRLAEAQQSLAKVLAATPRHIPALDLLCKLALHVRDYDGGVILAERALAADAGNGRFHFLLGRLRKGQNRLDEAEACYRRALALEPGLAEARVSLGITLKAQGRVEEAIACYEIALAQRPGFAEAQINLGNALRERGQVGKASRLYRQAAAAAPHLPGAQSALAASCLQQGDRSQAIAHYRQSLAADPRQPRLQYLLGNLLAEAGEPGALDALQMAVTLQPEFPDAWADLGLMLCQAGRKREGIGCFERAVEQDPAHPVAPINLAMAIGELGDTRNAERILRETLARHPDSPYAREKLGVALMWARKLDEAAVYLRQVVAERPADPAAKVLLAMALHGPGVQHEAVGLVRQALEMAVDDDAHAATNANAFSNLLLNLCYADGSTAREIAEEARSLGRQAFANPAPGPDFPASADYCNGQRRLRIGYVSPDLRRHSVSHFMAPILAGHDREQFEIHCYQNHAAEDEVSAELRRHADHWFNSYGLTDDQFIARVRGDGIDILVDLAGHTAHNRLLAFARRPAPVQMTWLGYPSTTGYAAIDYRITDWQVDPEGYEQFNSEIPLRLPGSYFCYRPGPGPEPGPPPALARGYVTFGSFNVLAKISETAVALWSQVLGAVPGSRLLVKAAALGEASTRERLVAAFAVRGIAAERIDLLAWEDKTASHLATYHRVDIALDTFPYNGATTTCEALWMGVPVVSLSGETHASRMGRSILSAAGLPELVTTTPEGYVRLAATLAADHAGLAQMRAGLRQRLARSPLLDGEGASRAVEALYRQAWLRWCAARAAPSPNEPWPMAPKG